MFQKGENVRNRKPKNHGQEDTEDYGHNRRLQIKLRKITNACQT